MKKYVASWNFNSLHCSGIIEKVPIVLLNKSRLQPWIITTYFFRLDWGLFRYENNVSHGFMLQ